MNLYNQHYTVSLRFSPVTSEPLCVWRATGRWWLPRGEWQTKGYTPFKLIESYRFIWCVSACCRARVGVCTWVCVCVCATLSDEHKCKSTPFSHWFLRCFDAVMKIHHSPLNIALFVWMGSVGNGGERCFLYQIQLRIDPFHRLSIADGKVTSCSCRFNVRWVIFTVCLSQHQHGINVYILD